jgi:hypothetical protein
MTEKHWHELNPYETDTKQELESHNIDRNTDSHIGRPKDLFRQSGLSLDGNGIKLVHAILLS